MNILRDQYDKAKQLIEEDVLQEAIESHKKLILEHIENCGGSPRDAYLFYRAALVKEMEIAFALTGAAAYELTQG